MMIRDGLFEMEGNRMVLKEKGEERARELIRRHRLTERLLLEIFEISEDEVEEEACKLEHILSPNVTKYSTLSQRLDLHPRETHSKGGVLHQVQKRNESSRYSP
jgi:Mn-dependent DtxR family transcriptional regulator